MGVHHLRPKKGGRMPKKPRAKKAKRGGKAMQFRMSPEPLNPVLASLFPDFLKLGVGGRELVSTLNT